MNNTLVESLLIDSADAHSGGLTDDQEAQIAEDCLEAATKLKYLQAVVKKLLKTADGVPVVPGMTVFWTGEGFSDEKRLQVQSGLVRAVFDKHVNVNGTLRSTHAIYSTQAAALEAIKVNEDG